MLDQSELKRADLVSYPTEASDEGLKSSAITAMGRRVLARVPILSQRHGFLSLAQLVELGLLLSGQGLIAIALLVGQLTLASRDATDIVNRSLDAAVEVTAFTGSG